AHTELSALFLHDALPIWPGVCCACPLVFHRAGLDRVAALILSPCATCCIRPDRSLWGGRRTPYPAVHATVAAATVARTGRARVGERRGPAGASAHPPRRAAGVAPEPPRTTAASDRVRFSTDDRAAAAGPLAAAASMIHSRALAGWRPRLATVSAMTGQCHR